MITLINIYKIQIWFFNILIYQIIKINMSKCVELYFNMIHITNVNIDFLIKSNTFKNIYNDQLNNDKIKCINLSHDFDKNILKHLNNKHKYFILRIFFKVLDPYNILNILCYTKCEKMFIYQLAYEYDYKHVLGNLVFGDKTNNNNLSIWYLDLINHQQVLCSCEGK